MDQAAIMMAALRAATQMGDVELAKAKVEALAAALGFASERLPGLIDHLVQTDQVSLGWGGKVTVKPERPASPGASTGFVFNAQGASFGQGATIAGRDASGGVHHSTPEAAFGVLVAVIAKLQEVRPSLQGEALEEADKAIAVLQAKPTAQASAEVRRGWMTEAGLWLDRLLKLAAAEPVLERVVELGHTALKGLGWS